MNEMYFDAGGGTQDVPVKLEDLGAHFISTYHCMCGGGFNLTNDVDSARVVLYRRTKNKP